MRQLSPCGPCGRHVYATEGACPFCRAPGRTHLVPVLVLAAASLVSAPAMAHADGDAGAVTDAGDAGGQAEHDSERYAVPIYGAPAEVRSCQCDEVGHDHPSPTALAAVGLAAAMAARRRKSRR